jgi:hypothetical protein
MSSNPNRNRRPNAAPNATPGQGSGGNQGGDSSQQGSRSRNPFRRFRRRNPNEGAGAGGGASSSSQVPPDARFNDQETPAQRAARLQALGITPPAEQPRPPRPDSLGSTLAPSERANTEDAISVAAPEYRHTPSNGTPAPSFHTMDPNRRPSVAPTTGSDGLPLTDPPSYRRPSIAPTDGTNGSGNGNGGNGNGNGNGSQMLDVPPPGRRPSLAPSMRPVPENGGFELGVPGPSGSGQAPSLPPPDKSTSSGSSGNIPVNTQPFQTNYGPGETPQRRNRTTQIVGAPQGFDPTLELGTGTGTGTATGGGNANQQPGQQSGGSYSQPGGSSGTGV